jgi:hypothetical protein
MSIDVQPKDRIEMKQRERDILKILHPVVQGERTQEEAARLLGFSVRHVRRLLRKIHDQGDQAVVHQLRGRPSNHALDDDLRTKVLAAYREHFSDFGPTFASEKLEGLGLMVSPDTLRRWLLAEGLWQRQRRRDPHRSRRPRRPCFGEMVQMDASIHDWLEGRGEQLVLITLIDDATSLLLARFYLEATVRTHMDLLGRWLRQRGRPRIVYTDRHSIFEPQDKGKALPDALTQFGRALKELGIELICARSPQAKGRVERSFGTAQDRWVKELRLAGATTCAGANEVLERLLPEHNQRFAKEAREASDAHRELGPDHNLEAILSVQEERVVSNDYTIRLNNRFYQLLPPTWPGQRGGKVVIEQRLDGSMKVRFQDKYLGYKEISGSVRPGGRTPRPPEFNACAADARLAEGEKTEAEEKEEKDRSPGEEARSPGVQPTAGRSGCTPTEPYPPNGEEKPTTKGGKKPAKNHPWREPFKETQR